MNLSTRLRALTRLTEQMRRPPEPGAVSVIARIEELTRLYAQHPPTFRPDLDAALIAAAARHAIEDEAS